MFDKEKYKSTIGFTDMLFNVLVGFAFLFIVAFLLIKPEQKKEDFERRAEFVVVMEWNHDQPDDIDLYVQDPTQAKVHFRLPIVNFMYLDKDDLGFANDVVKYQDGTTKKVNINREVVTIRGIIAGEYVINAHYYSSREWTRLGRLTTNPSDIPSKKVDEKNDPLTVKIELHKVDPYKIMWVGEKKFFKKGQEETFVRFSIDKDGNQIGDFSYEEKTFVTPFSNRHGYNGIAPDAIEEAMRHEPNGSTYIGGESDSHDQEEPTPSGSASSVGGW
tara:strand:- start:1089 stop:1910 length:822 start_codon:yes stop_codon:yes gene_type:complete